MPAAPAMAAARSQPVTLQPFEQPVQIVSTAAREGARLASQGLTINDNGSQTRIMASVAPPNTARTPGSFFAYCGS